MGNAKLIADLNRVKFSLNPYNINRLTLKAGQAALEDTAYFDRTRAAIVDTRSWTKQQLEARGFAVLDSRSNFLFASTDRKYGWTLYKELKKNGILVRHFDAPASPTGCASPSARRSRCRPLWKHWTKFWRNEPWKTG